MKKSLLALSAVAVMFIGCGNKISDEQVKNFETSLNNSIKNEIEKLKVLTAMFEIPSNVNISDYKCENKGDYAECKSKGIDVIINNQKVLSVEEIKIETNGFYTGDKKGSVSIKELATNTPKESFYKSEIKSIKLGEIAVGFASMLAISDNKLGILPELAKDEYSINTITKTKDVANNGNVKVEFKLIGKHNKNELAFAIDLDVLDKFFEICDKLNITYNIDSYKIDNVDTLDKYDMYNKEFAESLLINSIESKININNNLKAIKEYVMQNIDKVPEQFRPIVDSFFANTPHKFEQSLKVKNKYNMLKAIEESENQLPKDFNDNVEIKINGMNFTQIK